MKFECSKWIYRRNKNTLVDIAEYLHHRSRDRYHLNLLGFFKSKMFKRASRRPLNNVDFFDILLLKVANKTKLFGTKIPKFPFKLINHPQFEESTRNHGQSFRVCHRASVKKFFKCLKIAHFGKSCGLKKSEKIISF